MGIYGSILARFGDSGKKVVHSVIKNVKCMRYNAVPNTVHQRHANSSLGHNGSSRNVVLLCYTGTLYHQRLLVWSWYFPQAVNPVLIDRSRRWISPSYFNLGREHLLISFISHDFIAGALDFEIAPVVLMDGLGTFKYYAKSSRGIPAFRPPGA